jgi:serine protease Do
MNNKKIVFVSILTSMFGVLIGALIMYLFISFVLPINKVNPVIGEKKEVTVNDKGIADGVDNLYDAVVTISSLSNNNVIAGGTGFVYKLDNKIAYIITNNHVIDSGNKAMVKFTNGKEIEAKIVGNDAVSDIAVLSVESNDIIKVANIGSSKSARIGDTVFAIGSPVSTEYNWTVTRGILSGKDRLVEANDKNSGSYAFNVLQTDTSINSGNSGGPLANVNGDVIGITNMKLVASTVEGIGFAIPIEEAINIADELVKDGKVERPLLGVTMMDLQNKFELYKQGITLNTELKEGVVVVDVQKGSPADKSGIKRGDIIIKVDDIKITSVAGLRYQLYKHKLGDTINITYERNSKSSNASVKLDVINN